jgi:hypothetical protein
MAILSFTLSEEGVAVLHDALACIVKFSDDVCLEARKDKLTLTALNLSKSAYVCITLSANRFFSRYSFEGSGQFREKFFCQLYIRVCSLLSLLLPDSNAANVCHSLYYPSFGPGLLAGTRPGTETRRRLSNVAMSPWMTGLASKAVS